MKTFKEYITEAYNNYRLNELTVKFGVSKDDLIVQVPDTYLEDEIQMYLDDTIINKTFAGGDNSEDFFGKNADNIADAYFEYTGYEKTSSHPDLEFDAHYDEKANGENLKNVRLKDFKYVLQFDRFDVLNGSDDNVKEALNEIFNRCVSDEYEWPIKLTYNENDLEYNK